MWLAVATSDDEGGDGDRATAGVVVSGTRRNASSISGSVNPFCCKNEILEAFGLPLTCTGQIKGACVTIGDQQAVLGMFRRNDRTLGCDKNETAFCTWSSRSSGAEASDSFLKSGPPDPSPGLLACGLSMIH